MAPVTICSDFWAPQKCVYTTCKGKVIVRTWGPLPLFFLQRVSTFNPEREGRKPLRGGAGSPRREELRLDLMGGATGEGCASFPLSFSWCRHDLAHPHHPRKVLTTPFDWCLKINLARCADCVHELWLWRQVVFREAKCMREVGFKNLSFPEVVLFIWPGHKCL